MTTRPGLIATGIGLALLVAACGAGSTTGSGGSTDVRGGDAVAGRDLFANNCARCHGPAAGGTDSGPSFLSDIYVPSHHADEAFQRAVALGVQPHHWDFGAMPPVEDLTREQVADIVAYVRQLQRDAGLIE